MIFDAFVSRWPRPGIRQCRLRWRRCPVAPYIRALGSQPALIHSICRARALIWWSSVDPKWQPLGIDPGGAGGIPMGDTESVFVEQSAPRDVVDEAPFTSSFLRPWCSPSDVLQVCVQAANARGERGNGWATTVAILFTWLRAGIVQFRFACCVSWSSPWCSHGDSIEDFHSSHLRFNDSLVTWRRQAETKEKPENSVH